jgi:hypothetical protein
MSKSKHDHTCVIMILIEKQYYRINLKVQETNNYVNSHMLHFFIIYSIKFDCGVKLVKNRCEKNFKIQ